MMRPGLKWLLSLAVLAVPAVAAAQPLSVVNVGAPAINCVYATSCVLPATDTVANIPLPGIAGTARLQSRTVVGTTGAPAQGLHGYEYRVDLTNAVGILDIPCIQALRVTFGPVATLQYNGVGPTEQVYVVNAGGIGTIGLASATRSGDDVIFTFASPVCGGSGPGRGATSFFFGLASARAPAAVTAVATPLGGPALPVGARAPSLDKCTAGGPFPGGTSDACVASVCAVDPFCCNVGWDSLCVAEVRTVCGSLTCSESNGTCGHSLCELGGALVNSCDATKANCVADICAVDPFCCTSSWDAVCVAEVETVCGNTCD